MLFSPDAFPVREKGVKVLQGKTSQILKNFKVPDDLPRLVKQKVGLAQSAMNTEVIDAFLSGAPNDALNSGMQKIVAGQSTAREVAAEVESLLRK